MTFNVPIGYVRLARYCGKMYSRHLFPYGGLSVLKPKPKQLLRPITKNVNNTMDQSELEANTCNRCQARENACERGTIGFSLASHWLKKWCQLCQRKHKIDSGLRSPISTAIIVVHYNYFKAKRRENITILKKLQQ